MHVLVQFSHLFQADAFSGKYLAELASLFMDGIKSGNTHSGK